MADQAPDKIAEKRRLTRAEGQVLAVLVDPEFFGKTNNEKIVAAKVSERRFYEILADPWFQDEQKRTFLDIIRGNVGPVVRAAVQTASVEGRDGHQDRKMLLEMSGMYVAKQRNEVTGKDGGPLEVKRAEELSDDELAHIATSRGPGTAPATEGT